MGKAQLQRTHRAAGNTQAKQSLRVWLRLLACEGLVENSVRSRMRKEFSITLPQFDVLAELEHMAQPLNPWHRRQIEECLYLWPQKP